MAGHGHSHGGGGEPPRRTDDSQISMPFTKEDKGEPPKKDGLPTDEEAKNFAIVKATQYGAISRVQELIENGYDVNKRDEDEVSLLHWASINNRSEIVKYLLLKGADVDAVGGQLQATPLHWAVRQGHLGIAVTLVQHGADPRAMDIEGCGCIHIASQFGFTAIVAYFVAKGVDVNEQDQNGMTPLMWSCYRSSKAETSLVLLNLGASITMQDNAYQNTPVHWACLAKNYPLINYFIKKATLNFHLKNADKKTPWDIILGHVDAQKRDKEKNPFSISHFTMNKGRQLLEDTTSKQTWLRRNRSDIRKYGLLVLAIVAYGGFGWILQAEGYGVLSKIGMIVLFFMSVNVAAGRVVDERLPHLMPMVIYGMTKFWFYVVWVHVISGYLSPLTTFSFLCLSAVLWYSFLKTWRGDPGIVRASREEKLSTIVEISERENGDFDRSKFCHSCLVRKPLRSKHCSVCDVCVAKFDHHCPWVGNCIGEKNHRHFMTYLCCLIALTAWTAYGVVVTLLETAKFCDPTGDDDSWPEMLKAGARCRPFTAFVGATALFHFSWVSTLSVCQWYQVGCLAMTTNERMNAFRYTHFKDKVTGAIRSPFDKGCAKNVSEFLRGKASRCVPDHRMGGDRESLIV